MRILDANIIIRLFLRDNVEMANEAIDFIDNHNVLVLPEVAAEVIFVMTKFYKKGRSETAEALLELLALDTVSTNCGNVLAEGLKLYAKNSLDFVDCLLAAYHSSEDYEIYTFDKKLQKLIERMDAKNK